MSDLILYTTEDGGRDTWATVKDSLTVPFEVRRVATAEDSSVVQIEGGREVQRPVSPGGFASIVASRER